MNKAKLPTHVELDCTKYALVKDSVVLLESVLHNRQDAAER